MAAITCSMCGNVFEPGELTACAACPLHKGCQLVCCPACGFEMVDPQQSVLARLVMKLIERKQNPEAKKFGEKTT